MKKAYIDILPRMDSSVAVMTRDYMCPECGESGIDDNRIEKPALVGWCETEWGYMMVVECPNCFTKYRFHGTVVDKNDKFEFEHAIRCYILSRYFSNSEELENLAKFG